MLIAYLHRTIVSEELDSIDLGSLISRRDERGEIWSNLGEIISYRAACQLITALVW